MKQYGERELRAAGNILGQLRPRILLRDARDLVVKFQRDDVFRSYIAYRIWTVLPVILVFILVSTVCAVGIMFEVPSFTPAPLASGLALSSARRWIGGISRRSIFLLWLEGRAAESLIAGWSASWRLAT
jgi:hypothetical protein